MNRNYNRDSFFNRGGYQGGGGGGGGRYNSGNQPYRDRGPPRQSYQPSMMPPSVQYPEEHPTQLKPGTLGRPVQLIGNFYKLITAKVITVFHYRLNVGKPNRKDIGDKSDEKKRQSLEKFYNKFTKEIVDEFVKQNGEIFGNDIRYIYSNLAYFYTNKELCLEHPAMKNDLIVSIEERDKEIKIVPELVDQFELDPDLVFSHTKLCQEIGRTMTDCSEKILTVYDILFGFLIGKQYECFRRKYFDLSTARPLHCRPFIESVSGIFSSVRRTQFGLALNLHLKSGCKISNRFRMLTELVQAMLRTDRTLTMDSFTVRDLGHINRIVHHLRVFTKHGGRQTAYQIDKIVIKTAADQTILNQKTGQNISVKAYYQQEYNIQVRPLPLVQTVGRRYLIPMELCHLFANQFLADNKLGQKVQDEMLQRSKFSPTEYFDKLQRIVDSIVQMDPEVYNKFSVNVIPKPAQFEGRVLDRPRVVPGRDRLLTIVRRRISVSFYCFLDNRPYPPINNNQLYNFCDDLLDKLEYHGYHIGKVSAKCVEIGRLTDIEDLFLELGSESEIPDLLMTGLLIDHQMDSKKQYNLVKHLANQKYHFVSQCFDIDKVARSIKPNYLANIILKINAKLGGINSEIEQIHLDDIGIDFSRTMLVGVDVNHPGACEKVESSIACAVGSYDEQFYCYSASIRVQKRERQEVVTQLESMVDELLTEYYKMNRFEYPANIIVFRDGVSEGQFKAIKDVEIPLIQKSIDKVQTKLGSSIPIKLTVVVIQKRHQTRFSLISPNLNFRRETYNVSSGTVVDQSIVDPDHEMFLLNSHDSAMGTSKSSKYVLLRDDLALSTDQLETLCYYSCYNCCRTLHPISIPTPVRYADLCAYRSKLHILAQVELQANQLNVEATDIYSLASRMEQMELEAINKLNKMVKVDNEVKNQLYYC